MGFPAIEGITNLQIAAIVSIPDRDLWVFRQLIEAIARHIAAFQSLIGIYGFSGASKVPKSIYDRLVSIPDRDLWVFRH